MFTSSTKHEIRHFHVVVSVQYKNNNNLIIIIYELIVRSLT